MRFDILTLFPGFFSGPLDHGILSRAIADGTVQVALHDLRDFTHDRHRTVDDRPFGGGEGMVLKPQPIFDCIESLGAADRNAEDRTLSRDRSNNLLDKRNNESNRSLSEIAPPTEPKSTRNTSHQSVILLSAQGKPFTQATAHRLAALDHVVLICGRYEGVDERVAELLADEELSIGDYVLSGGELAAAVVLDATVRLLPGVLGHADSARYESFGVPDIQPGDPASGKTPDGVPRSTHGSGGILDYPQYTRPADFRDASIPEVLANGDHAAIRRWRRQAALAKTLRNRPDLLARAPLTPEDRAFLATLGYPKQPSS
ncbi:MAG: tRNA (guanosine(37)-N1)-methyltransferase TrmD [Acidobacteriaceae bacterium]